MTGPVSRNADPGGGGVAPRGDRRRARTRAALVGAAQTLLAREGGTEASIQEITDLADVGFGSFYNHFTTKTELFDAAIIETLDEHGAVLDRFTAGIEDPAEVFATSLRLTARMIKTHPQTASTIRHTGMAYLASDRGLAPRAIRDIVLARDAGRFTIGRPEIALACVGGALLGVLQVIGPGTPPREVDRASDELARYVLLMFGLPAAEAEAISTRRLPAVRTVRR